MNRHDPQFDRICLDEFEETLPDRPRNERWELIGGRLIKMMAGTRWEHHRIIADVDRQIDSHIRVRGLPCRTFRETFWLTDRKQNFAVFPDIVVHCGRLAPGQMSVDDPVVLIEVISRSSSFRDRLEKHAAYEKLASLAHIVLVSTDHFDVEVLTRSDDGSWTARRAELLTADFALPAIDFAMSLREVYRDVADDNA